ncbi:MAG: hypothetical protein EA401_14495 [Planctomycetota bacterium]|nr:MAG: hypothetical protein EA401_14495 [Planctomycetota bacterium]
MADTAAYSRKNEAIHDAEMARVIAAESRDEGESRATSELYSALVEHRGSLSGDGKITDQDAAFSESVRREASRRSAEITAYRQTSSQLTPVDGKPIPRWLIIAWAIAVLAAVIAILLLLR